MEWNGNGDTLFVNVLKKYVMVVQFATETFGRKFNVTEKNELIVATYGASGAS
jgi:hypothetical protein